MQLKLSFRIVQKLKFDSILDAKLMKSFGITIETMDVDVETVTKIFRCQAAVLAILDAPAMSQATIWEERQAIVTIGEAKGASVTDVLGFIIVLVFNYIIQASLHEQISFLNK